MGEDDEELPSADAQRAAARDALRRIRQGAGRQELTLTIGPTGGDVDLDALSTDDEDDEV